MIAPDNVLEFWFKDDHTLFRAEWFVANSAFDATCTSFAEALQAARNGSLDQWADTPRGTLALIVLLDQFSRNLHRGSPEAYAADAQARALARDAVSRGLDKEVHPMERLFLYLPFEHSEDLADHHELVRLFEAIRLALGDFNRGACLSPPRRDPPVRPLSAPECDAGPREHRGGAAVSRAAGRGILVS